MWIMIRYCGLMVLSRDLSLGNLLFLRNTTGLYTVWHCFVLGLAHRRGCSHGIPQDQSSDCGVLRHALLTNCDPSLNRKGLVHLSDIRFHSALFLGSVCECVCMNERRTFLFISATVWTTCLFFFAFCAKLPIMDNGRVWFLPICLSREFDAWMEPSLVWLYF